MKRVFKFVIMLAILFFIFQFAVTFFINKHEIVYNIAHDNKNYNVKEQFIKKNKQHYYNFEVLDKEKNKFIFYFNEDYNKQKKILKDIEIYNNDQLTCILPVYKDNKISGIICRNKKDLVSYDHMKRLGVSFDNWKNELKTKGYIINDTDTVIKEDKVTLYQEFPADYSITLWNYHGLYILNKDRIKKLSILDNDYYENTSGVLVGKYYVIANTDQDFSYNRIYLVDVLDESKSFVDLDIEISKDSYFLGAVEDDVYILDRDKKKEYAFNIKTKKLKEVGNIDSNARMYINGKWEDKNIYTVSEQKEKFQSSTIIPEINELYHPKQMMESINKYYFVTDDNCVYYVMKEDIHTKVLLFQDDHLTDLKLIDDDLFFLSGKDIVMYNLTTGYRKIVTHTELLYNNKNIYDVIKK